MIAYKNDVFRALKDRDESLGLCRLCCFINQHLSELDVPDSPVKCGNASSADDIGTLDDFVLSLLL